MYIRMLQKKPQQLQFKMTWQDLFACYHICLLPDLLPVWGFIAGMRDLQPEVCELSLQAPALPWADLGVKEGKELLCKYWVCHLHAHFLGSVRCGTG